MEMTLSELDQVIESSIFKRHVTGVYEGVDIWKAVQRGELDGHSFRDVSFNVTLGGIIRDIYLNIEVESQKHLAIKLLGDVTVRSTDLYVQLIGDALLIQ